MSPTPYTYTPLPPSQIRLLTLLPSPSPLSPLHTTLHPVPLPITSIDLKFQLLKKLEETWWQGRPQSLTALDWRGDRFWDELNKFWEWKGGYWVLSEKRTSLGAEVGKVLGRGSDGGGEERGKVDGGFGRKGKGFGRFKEGLETWKVLYQEVFGVDVRSEEWPGLATTYEAVSYMWGDDEPDEEVFIDGHPIRVRKNLLGALKRLRKSDKPKVVWVDALCIDQSNDGERAAQVGIMGSIYRNAKWTSIWLGEHDDTSPTAMQIISTMTISGDNDVVRDNWRAVAELADRPYWGRLWVVQELYMSRKQHLRILCGKDEVSWIQFCLAVTELLSFYAAHLLPNSEREKHFLVPRFASAIMKIMDSGIQPLATLVETCREFKCGDPHDRLYGLLGMAADSEGLNLIPDYGVGIRGLYGECMRAMMPRKNIFRERNTQSTSDLVRFSRSLQDALENPFWEEEGKCFGLPPTEKLPAQKRRIKMFTHGEIVFLCATMPREKEALFLPQVWRSFMEEIIGRFSLQHLKRVWAGCAGLLTDIQTLERIVGFREPGHDEGIMDIDEERGIQIFVMQDGSYGLVPSNAVVGDLLCTDSDWSDMTAVAVLRKDEDGKNVRLIGRAIFPSALSQRYADFEHHMVDFSITEIQLLSR